MDCRDFREQHVAYVDDVASAQDMAAMRQHLQRCRACAHHDTAVRRALLLARNLPEVYCSADFMERLHARLRESGATAELPAAARAWHLRQSRAFALLAASVLAVAGLAAAMSHWGRPPALVRLAPVVASIPETPPSPMITPVYMAPMAAGLPVWTAVLAADETPFHLANMELRDAAR